MTTLYALATYVTLLDPAPQKEDVKAGWGAFGIFMLMAVAVALLGWSLTRHLRKTKENAAMGAFGEVPDAENAAKDAERSQQQS